MKKIYLDYAATTPVKREVVEAMMPYYQNMYSTKKYQTLIEKYEVEFFELIHAKTGFIRFNAGGSAGNNDIIKSFAQSFKEKGKHMITSKIEHPSVYRVMEKLEKDGFEITYIACDAQGHLDLEALQSAFRPDTILASFMLVNNEIGARQPIEAIAKLCKMHDVFLHVDAVQALGNIALDVDLLGADAVTFSAHKIYAPKGCGAVYVRDQKWIDLFGSQVCIISANVPYIAGFIKGVHLALQDLDVKTQKKSQLRDRLIAGMLALELGIKVNGHTHHPGIVNFFIPHMDGDSLVINYDRYGIALSSGSACSSGALSASHVLKALGMTDGEASRCIRMSLGDFTTESDIDEVVDITAQILKGYKYVG